MTKSDKFDFRKCSENKSESMTNWSIVIWIISCRYKKSIDELLDRLSSNIDTRIQLLMSWRACSRFDCWCRNSANYEYMMIDNLNVNFWYKDSVDRQMKNY